MGEIHPKETINAKTNFYLRPWMVKFGKFQKVWYVKNWSGELNFEELAEIFKCACEEQFSSNI